MSKINLKALSKDEIKEFVKAHGLSDYRTKQMLHWIYEKGAESIEDITELSKDLRKKLSDIAYISNLKLLNRQISKDGTEKFLFELEDGEAIECVLIPDEDRLTLCISSQVGCAMGCGFCLTGKIGFKRNLKAFEIVDQIIAVSRLIKETAIPHHPRINPLLPPFPKVGIGGLLKGSSMGITNIVFMGMGEPLLNFAEVVEALKRITEFVGFSKRRITLSTCGIAPKIIELYKKAPHVNLAISLNASNNEVRDKIMPINKKYPGEVLLKACGEIPLSPRNRITFEYVMLDGINDKPSDAKQLVKILKGIPSKVNLIPFNPYEGSNFKRPLDDNVLGFQAILVKAGISVFIRKSKGQDILAACGQLKAGYKQKVSSSKFKVMNKVIILLGPTGVGKTEVSILLAKALDTEIISADSMQIYKGMDIGTAKPTKKQRTEMKHHMIDIIEPSESYSVGRYIGDVQPIIESLHRKGKIPIIVGGTGLYIKAMTKGIFSGPSADWKLREELNATEKEQEGSLYDYLKQLDPEAAGEIMPADTRRIIRAIEVCLKTNNKISGLQKKLTRPLPYDFVKIGLTRDRKELYKMIEERVDEMVRAGLVEEVKRLIEMLEAETLRHGDTKTDSTIQPFNYSTIQRFSALQAIGYKEIAMYLNSEISLEEAIRLIKRDTKRYAKRQFTWFKKEENIHWLDVTGIYNSNMVYERINHVLYELL